MVNVAEGVRVGVGLWDGSLLVLVGMVNDSGEMDDRRECVGFLVFIGFRFRSGFLVGLDLGFGWVWLQIVAQFGNELGLLLRNTRPCVIRYATFNVRHDLGWSLPIRANCKHFSDWRSIVRKLLVKR